MLESELAPLEDFRKITRRLWWIVALVLLGGALGWLIHSFRPPVYEAKSLIVVSLDFEQTGPIQELEQDQLVFAAIGLFSSPYILDEVTQELQAIDPDFDPLVIGQNAVVERRRSQIYLIVRQDDLQGAVDAANLWGWKAYKALQAAHRNAVLAESLSEYVEALSTCPTPPAETADLSGFCGQLSPDEIEQELQRASLTIDQVTAQAMGIVSAIGYEQPEAAEIPIRPIAYDRWSMILGGALIGLAAAVVLASLLPIKERHSR